MVSSERDISVVICVYTEDRWDDIVAAVESVGRQTVPVLETIVVVDHNPHLLSRVRESLPHVVAVENLQPRGLSGARNCGLAVARGAFIAFLDDDAVAAPDWLAWLMPALSDARVLGVGGLVEPGWVGKPPRWFPEEFLWTVGCSYRGLPRSTAQVRNPFGGCTCIRREVFEAVGGFRSGIGRVGKRPLGCEETELAIRARKHWPDGMFVYEPRARIRHKVPVDRGRWSYFRARCYAEGLSKARVTSFGGSKDGLASERAYTLRTLPLGVLTGLRDAVLHQDTAGLARAGALVLGFAFTVAGYAVETLTERIGPAREFANDPPPVIGPPPERVGHSIEFVATPVLAGTVDPA